jgi:hypothetical protein
MANLSTKCSDRCYVSINGQESDGYAPSDMGIDGDDYVSFAWCLNCGHMVGEWPLPPTALEQSKDDSEDEVQSL